MAEINVGTVKIVLPPGIEIDARAGKLSDEEKREVPRVRKGIGLACDQTAVEIEKVGTSFSIPGVTASGIAAKGVLAEGLDEVIEDMEIALETLKQANLLADADAYTDLRKVNNQVKAQADFQPELKDRFATVITYFSSKRKSK